LLERNTQRRTISTQMTGTELRQRLAAILAADVAEYSRLMAADEAATVAALDAARSVFREQIGSAQGRVIDMAGDSVLAVFELATRAVSAALETQRRLAAAAVDVAEERRMRFRIGVHLGEIIEKADGSIYGDGVNIAARLEGLAAPGGIAVSDAVRSAVRGKVDAAFDDLGEQQVKNIAEPVRAYRVRAEGAAAPAQKIGEIDLSLPDKPSIAVLPFTNMSGDSEQEYFTDGITEDIITELSRYHSLFVIARNSSFTYKGRAVDVRTVAKELGVRYVVEGSIRRAGKRIRVTAQLVDSTTGNHLWAERYDRELEDVFAVQEEVTRAIVTAIAPQIDSAELEKASRKRPESLGAYEIALRARAHVLDAWMRSDVRLRDEAMREANEALAIDPRSTIALNALAWAYAHRVVNERMAQQVEPWQAGMTAVNRAIDADRSDSDGYAYKALLLCFEPERRPMHEGLTVARHALQLNPNSMRALVSLAFSEIVAGNPRAAIEVLQTALRLSPLDPLRYLWYTYLAMASCTSGDYVAGIEYALVATTQVPGFAVGQVSLAQNYVGAGEIEKARATLDIVRRLAPALIERAVSGGLYYRNAADLRKMTSFVRVAARLEDPSAADALR
jgi:adenylate cyclase